MPKPSRGARRGGRTSRGGGMGMRGGRGRSRPRGGADTGRGGTGTRGGGGMERRYEYGSFNLGTVRKSERCGACRGSNVATAR